MACLRSRVCPREDVCVRASRPVRRVSRPASGPVFAVLAVNDLATWRLAPADGPLSAACYRRAGVSRGLPCMERNG
eukprot:1702823-Prymnesium_polylepis.1